MTDFTHEAMRHGVGNAPLKTAMFIFLIMFYKKMKSSDDVHKRSSMLFLQIRLTFLSGILYTNGRQNFDKTLTNSTCARVVFR